MHKYNIVINGRFLTQKITGVQRYAHELIFALDRAIENKQINTSKYELILILPRNINIKPKLNNIKIKYAGLLKGQLWEQLELPFYARKSLLVNLCNTAPLFFSKKVVVIHDASVFVYPEGYSRLFRLWYQFLLPLLCNNAELIITNSMFSRGELIKYCNVLQHKVYPIHLGADHFLSIISDERIIYKYNLKNIKYVLAVGSMNRNKNFTSLADAVKFLNDSTFQVVIVGNINSDIFGVNEIISHRIRHIGYVSDSELKALYQNAACFVFPSLYEGFGIPPLEAMSCGCPVITSNAASMPEVCGNAALYFDPNNPYDIAEKIKLVLNNSTISDEMRVMGLERARKFTWNKCVQNTWKKITENLYL